MALNGTNKIGNGGNLGFDAELFNAAAKLDTAIAANLTEFGYGE